MAITRIIYCTLLLLFLQRTAEAQHSYIPIPDSAIYITEREDWLEGYNPPQPHIFYYNVGYFWNIDTVINTKKYMCYYEAQSNHLPYSGSYLPIAGIWIHQDTIAKKVWIVQDQMFVDSAYLMYDFSLLAGDSITDNNHIFFRPVQDLAGHKAWIDQVDSLYFPDGAWRYRWLIKTNYSSTSTPAEVVLIEGMGYTTGFRNDPLAIHRPMIFETEKLLCFNGDNQWLYHIPNMWGLDCDEMPYQNALSVTTTSGELNKPLLYPNPLSLDKELRINAYSGNDICKLEAYDLTGKKILNELIRPGSGISLYQYGLVPGLYLFKLSDKDNNIIHTQKIVLQ